MLDIKFIRENRAIVEDSIKRRELKVDLVHLLDLDDQRRHLLQVTEGLRSQLKSAAKPTVTQRATLHKLKQTLEDKAKKLTNVQSDYNKLLHQVPNILAADTPDGGEDKSLF